MIEITGEGKSAVATPEGKKPKEEEEEEVFFLTVCVLLLNKAEIQYIYYVMLGFFQPHIIIYIYHVECMVCYSP